jgi:hypothetical protein
MTNSSQRHSPSRPPARNDSASCRPLRRRQDDKPPAIELPTRPPMLSPGAAGALLRLLLDADGKTAASSRTTPGQVAA